MARQKQLISYPRLNDAKGDVTKRWYIEYAFRTPTDEKEHRFRIYNNLCSGSAAERYAVAESMIAQINEYLKSGEYLHHEANYNPVRESDSHRPEAAAYNEIREKIQLRAMIDTYLESIRPGLRKKSYQTYTSKLGIFADYADKEILYRTAVDIKKEDLIPFLSYLATEKQLSRTTVKKYIQILHMFFDFVISLGYRQEYDNPARRLPIFGCYKDCSPVPLEMDDRERLRLAIERKDPFLWLACEMMYYMAIRPGTELRLLTIGDIDFEKRTVTVRSELAKNKKQDILPIPKEVQSMMEKLNLQRYESDLYVFGKNGIPSDTPLGQNTMRNRFNLYRDQLGIDKRKTYYSWKHSGAISLIDNNIPAIDLKDHMRHTSLETTMAYIKKHKPKNDIVDQYIDQL